MSKTCTAETRLFKAFEPKTFRCQKPHGHEGGHTFKEASKGTELLWFGTAAEAPISADFQRSVWRKNFTPA